MLMRKVVVGVVVLMSVVWLSHAGHEYDIKQGFYKERCTYISRGLLGLQSRVIEVDVEKVVADIVLRRFKKDPTIVAALLRLQFHDCFTYGCDASILLTRGIENSEKTALPNLSVRGDDLIEEIKGKLEGICPGVVSCADIIAMATRDAIYFGSYDEVAWFEVETGRRDGTESKASNVVDLPPPNATISDSLRLFAKKYLNAADLVYLLGGGHSVGVTHCRFIQDRLFNFRNTGKPDPSMNPELLNKLQEDCQNDPNLPIKLDQGTPYKFDNSLFRQVLLYSNGIFRGDQELAFHPETRPIVDRIVGGTYRDFSTNFGIAMRNMQAIGVLTGSQGQIRTSCYARK